MASSNTEPQQVVIIGAGVAGCSTAIRLLHAGIQPVVIDAATFPRDTIGEGLSAAVGPYLEDLGILDQINNGPFVKKSSLQIVATNGDVAYTQIDFSKKCYQNGFHTFPWGFNVRRKYFDQIFLERAKELGADIRLQTKVTDFQTDESGAVTGVFTVGKNGQETLIRSNLVIDCSGRDSVIAKFFALRAPLEHVFDGQWANFAIRLHFSNVNYKPLIKDNAKYDLATVNIIPDKDCWYWFIPINLDKEVISVGFVARGKMQKLFDGYTNKTQAYVDLIARHPILKEVIKGADV
jgi:flavin-dependent dehydrogenase